MSSDEKVIDAEFEEDEPKGRGARPSAFRALDSVIEFAEAAEKPLRRVHVETAEKVKQHTATFKQMRDEVVDLHDKGKTVGDTVNTAVKAGKEFLTKAGVVMEKVNKARGSAFMRRRVF